MKMKRRKAQVKKKDRLKRQALERKAAHVPGAKKPTPSRRASKPAVVLAPPAPAVAEVPPVVATEEMPSPE
jgi:hypothetical protein